MTICLAALCTDDDGEPRAVVAADRMVVLSNFIEFEHAAPKMAEATASAVAMIAGDALVGSRLVSDVVEELAGSNPRTVEIAQRLAAHYVRVRDEKAEQAVLVPRGLTMERFYATHQSLAPQAAMHLDQQLSQFALTMEILLAGVDAAGAHLFTVGNPGRYELQYDVIGYAAIGSGALHAVQSMIGFGHATSAALKDTVFRVYAAKRRAEVAPGVGTATDVAVISATGTLKLSETQLAQLAAVYESYEQAVAKALENEVAALELDAFETAGDAGG